MVAPSSGGEQGSEDSDVTRTFAMKVYAASYWLLAAVFVYIIVVLLLPLLAENPDEVGAFLPVLVVFLAVLDRKSVV